MIKYATAIRAGTASTEAILRRFTRNATHPTYQAMLEVGRAQKTIFVARYLRDRDAATRDQRGPQRDRVLEPRQRRHLLRQGRRHRHQPPRRAGTLVLCLHILQAALVYVNTLMIQDILAEPDWAGVLTAEDRRGLTPLFWTHVRPTARCIWTW